MPETKKIEWSGQDCGKKLPGPVELVRIDPYVTEMLAMLQPTAIEISSKISFVVGGATIDLEKSVLVDEKPGMNDILEVEGADEDEDDDDEDEDEEGDEERLVREWEE